MMSSGPSIRRALTPVPLVLRRASEVEGPTTDELEAGDLSLASTMPSPTQPTAYSSISGGGSSSQNHATERSSFGASLRPPMNLRRSSSLTKAGSGSSSPTSSRSRKATLTRANELPTVLLPTDLLERLHEWIECIAVVNFDLDVGPGEMEHKLLRFHNVLLNERNAIAFSSFPDHNEKGDSTLSFSWRLPRLRSDGVTPSDVVLHGYCYFSQVRDPRIRRGYAQRSLAILTRHYGYPGLFSTLVNIIGPMYFRSSGHTGSTTSPAAVEAGIYNISRWPVPQPGSSLELAFLGHVINVEIPLLSQAQFRIPSSSSLVAPDPHARTLSGSRSPSPTGTPVVAHAPPAGPLLASLPLSSLSLTIRQEIVDQLWLIWELVVLAEPILVYAPDPALCSEVVRWLVTLVRPLTFAGEYRPFFHIHLPDFAVLLNNNAPRPGLLLGATNPLILSGARHFPHIIRLAAASRASGSTDASPVHGVFGTLAKVNASQSFKDAQASAHGLFSNRKRTVRKDRIALKLALERMRVNDFAGADAILIRSLTAMTERFLVPLNRYFATLMPPDAPDEMARPRDVQGFSQDRFMQSLKLHGTPLDFKRSRIPSMQNHFDPSTTTSAVAFYERFLRSPNFLGWLRDRSKATESTARSRYLYRLEHADPASYLRGKGEAAMSDLIERLESEAHITDQALDSAPAQAHQRSQSHNPTSSPTFVAVSTAADQELRVRSRRLRTQVEKVRAIRQAALDSSAEDSDSASVRD